jgi:hypothetical protein
MSFSVTFASFWPNNFLMASRAAILHQSPWQGVFIITGGGSGLLAEMLCQPGASATVLEARVPYASVALEQLLGARPDQACSAATARAMAMVAFQRALELTSLDTNAAEEEQLLFGLGCTASLATSREKRGAHRAHVAIQTATITFTVELSLSGNRESEERVLVDALWQALDTVLELGIPDLDQPGAATLMTAQPGWQALILGDSSAHLVGEHDGKLLLPGAFNPLHDGHRQMLTIAERLTGLPGGYELSVANVDKPFLDYQEISRRLAQFEEPVWLTHLPTFIEKARHFTGARFVVGIDTLLRIADDAYYASESAMLQVFAEFAELGAGFVVFGRDLEAENFKVLDDVLHQLPTSLTDLCTGVDAATFRDSISSTELRRTTR